MQNLEIFFLSMPNNLVSTYMYYQVYEFQRWIMEFKLVVENISNTSIIYKANRIFDQHYPQTWACHPEKLEINELNIHINSFNQNNEKNDAKMIKAINKIETRNSVKNFSPPFI